MTNDLKEGSKSYHGEAHYYEEFSKAQDFPKKIAKFLLPRIKNKVVLDLGCGNGKYAKIFAPFSKKYYGLDISKEQLKLAKQKTKNINNIKFIHSSAEEIPLPDESVDIVFATWVISTINGLDRKEKALKEINKILKEDGEVYLLENDFMGELQEIRGTLPDNARKKEYFNLFKEKGFKEIKKLETYLQFDSLEDAKRIMGAIWGEKVKEKVKNKIIKQKIIIFRNKKIKTKIL